MARGTFHNSESGSLTFFAAAVVLPILILLFTIGLQVGNIFTQRAVEQKVVEAAALYAVKQLPHKNTAVAGAQAYLSNNSITIKTHGLSQATINTSFDSVSIDLAIPFSFPGAKYFDFHDQFTTYVRASARIQPKDVGIYFDSSSYMMPENLDAFANDPDPAAGGWWGKQIILPDWSYNNFFVLTNIYNSSDSLNWREAQFFRTFNNPTAAPRTALKRTQICFNPTYSAVKEAVIRLYYANSQLSLNSVGVFTGPSQADATLPFIIRPVRKGGYFLGQSEGALENVNFNLTGFDWRDQHCLAAAQLAQTDLDSWRQANASVQEIQLPPAQMRHAYPQLSAETDTAILNHNNAGLNPAFADTTTGAINPTLRAFNLSVREAVWGRRAYVYPTTNQEVSLGIKDIITSVGGAVLAADPRVAERGELVNTTSKQVFIILGNFPRANIGGALQGYESATTSERQTIRNRLLAGLSELHTAAANLQQPLSIYITMLGRYDPKIRNPVTGALLVCTFSDCPEFETAVREIRDAIENWELTHPKIRVTFERVMNQVGLPSTWVSHMGVAERQAYLSN
jgi:hypothetical protein